METQKKPTYEEFVARLIKRNNGNPKGLDAIKAALLRGEKGRK